MRIPVPHPSLTLSMGRNILLWLPGAAVHWTRSHWHWLRRSRIPWAERHSGSSSCPHTDRVLTTYIYGKPTNLDFGVSATRTCTIRTSLLWGFAAVVRNSGRAAQTSRERDGK